jgi:hypothetical protein
VAAESELDALGAAAKKAFAAPFGAVVKLEPESGAPLWVDGHKNPPQILMTPPDGAGESCLWRGAREALIRAMAGARGFESAYVAGRVSISGDMSVMARITLGENR